MNKDKIIMLTTAFVSALCVIWALYVPAHWIAAGLILNSIISVYLAFKMN